MASVAPVAPNAARASFAGIAEARTAVRVSTTVWLTPGRVSSHRSAAADADFVVALYNPVSGRRREGLVRARDILLEHRPADTPVVIARNLGRADEAVRTVALPALTPDDAAMLTILIVGSSQTRRVTAGSRDWVYTPRGYAAKRPR